VELAAQIQVPIGSWLRLGQVEGEVGRNESGHFSGHGGLQEFALDGVDNVFQALERRDDADCSSQPRNESLYLGVNWGDGNASAAELLGTRWISVRAYEGLATPLLIRSIATS
jgi:hypothetical protein